MTENNVLTTAQLMDEFYNSLSSKSIYLTRKETKSLIDNLIPFITDKLNDGFRLKIHNFGTFETVIRAPKPGRNPVTGQKIIIAPKRVIKYKMSPTLKNKMNQEKIDET